jgi:hypothetical protein
VGTPHPAWLFRKLELARALERRPWPLDELRMLLGVDNEEDADAIVRSFGLRSNADGLYEVSEEEESRLLDVITREAARGRVQPEWDDTTPFDRLKSLLTTGEFPEAESDSWPYQSPSRSDRGFVSRARASRAIFKRLTFRSPRSIPPP